MIQVELLKDVEVGKKGEMVILPDPAANYLIRVGAAIEHVKDKENDKQVKRSKR
jgi:ribosomal protein L9